MREQESEDTPMMCGQGFMFCGYGFSWGVMLLMLLGMALWIALLVVLVWALIRWLDRRNPVTPTEGPGMPASGPSAIEILRQRYGRGEIDTATFERSEEHTSELQSPCNLVC